MSFSKVRALTRIATPENEEKLLECAEVATTAQLERIVRGWRAIDRADEQKREEKRHCLTYFDEDEMCVVSARLLPEEGALLIKAIAAARQKGHSLADAFVAMAERSLCPSEKASGDRYRVIVHKEVGVEGGAVEARPGESLRITPETFAGLSCDATTIEVTHDHTGSVLDVGRKTRRISAKLRLAVMQRDHGCRFPGCDNKFADTHHVRHWQDGGETKLDSLMSLCGYHHGFIHRGGAILGFDKVFRYPDGRVIENRLSPAVWPLPVVAATDIELPAGHALDLGYALSVLHGA